MVAVNHKPLLSGESARELLSRVYCSCVSSLRGVGPFLFFSFPAVPTFHLSRKEVAFSTSGLGGSRRNSFLACRPPLTTPDAMEAYREIAKDLAQMEKDGACRIAIRHLDD